MTNIYIAPSKHEDVNPSRNTFGREHFKGTHGASGDDYLSLQDHVSLPLPDVMPFRNFRST